MKKVTALALVLAVAGTLAGCDRYRVTLNERVMSEPPGLLRDVTVADPALQGCIDQTIVDLEIHTIDGLDTLVCTNAGIKSVDGIEALTHLRTLNLASNQLTTVAPLQFLGKLTSVNLVDNDQLACEDIAKLRQHLPGDGTLAAPKQCQQ